MLAWRLGNWMGMVKMPDPAKVLAALRPREPVRQMTTEELMHRMDLWRVAVAPTFTRT